MSISPLFPTNISSDGNFTKLPQKNCKGRKYHNTSLVAFLGINISLHFLTNIARDELINTLPHLGKGSKKKSRIRETKHLLTDADSSKDNTLGWTKNTPKPIFFCYRKKSSKTQKRVEICQY